MDSPSVAQNMRNALLNQVGGNNYNNNFIAAADGMGAGGSSPSTYGGRYALLKIDNLENLI